MPSSQKDGLISGAAILGFYAAIKICRRDGYDPRGVFEIVLAHVGSTFTDTNEPSCPCVHETSEDTATERLSHAKDPSP